MFGTRLTVSVLAIAPLLMSASAQAADYSYPPPPQPYYQPPPQQVIIQQPAPEFAGNWYLRGQVGMGITGYNKFDISPLNPGDTIAGHSISDAYFIGGGVGYEWNSWLRFDATVEYRFKSNLYALGYYPGPPAGTDNYHGQLSSLVFLANGYVDLGTWDCFTPFVGAGIGFARNSITNLVDENAGAGTYGTGRDTAKWNLAWAIYAGVTYNVSKSFKVDLTYRYLSYGSAEDTIDCAGGCGGYNLEYKNLYSHDFMIAFRWLCCDYGPPPPPPYVPPPPPPYVPPPLHSKG